MGKGFSSCVQSLNGQILLRDHIDSLQTVPYSGSLHVLALFSFFFRFSATLDAPIGVFLCLDLCLE